MASDAVGWPPGSMAIPSARSEFQRPMFRPEPALSYHFADMGILLGIVRGVLNCPENTQARRLAQPVGDRPT